MNTEKIKHHIEALQAKHRKLDTQINIMEAAGHFTPDIEADIAHFKKEKLRIKDEIRHFENQILDQ